MGTKGGPEIERWDAVNPSTPEEAASLGYGAKDVGELFLQCDGQFVAQLARIEDAASVIARHSGLPAVAIHRRWVAARSRFVFNLSP